MKKISIFSFITIALIFTANFGINYAIAEATDEALFGTDSSSNENQDNTGLFSGDNSTNPNQDNTGLFSGDNSTNPNQDNTGLFSSDPSTNENQDDPTVIVEKPVVPVVVPVSNVSRGGSSSKRIVAVTPIVTISSCPLITQFMSIDDNNDNSEVMKLQAFLKAQGFTVSVNGVFDLTTENAVKAFQSTYLTEVMGPWGQNVPSGYVYITTKKKINEIACKSPFTLTAGELATINTYIQNRNKPVAATPVDDTIENISTTTETNTIGTSTDAEPIIIGSNEDNSAMTAAAINNAPALERLWNWIKGLFN